MRAYDLHVHSEFSEGESTLEQLARMAKDLGYSGFCFTAHWKDQRQLEIIETEIERVEKVVGVRTFSGFEARDIRELRKLAEMRRMFDILLVRGGDLETNRAAVETPEVDILSRPEYGRNDSGMNHTLAKLAAKNNVAIEINLRSIMTTSGYNRAKILKQMRQNVMLAKKYKAPLVVCSGGISHFELRDPMSMASMVVQLGLDLKGAKGCVTTVPEEIIGRAKERRSEKWVMPGVKVVG